MKCESIRDILLDYVDGALTGESRQAVAEHVAHCQSCQRRIAQEQKIKHALRELPVRDPPSTEFYERVLNASANAPKRGFNTFWAGFGSAVAAGLAGWLVFAPAQLPQATDDSLLPNVQAMVNEVKLVRVAFEAPADFRNVTLSVVLPENVELDGFPLEHEIAWQTTLHEGQNVLTLPVIVKRAGSAVVEAHISSANKSKIFRIQVQGQPEAQTGTPHQVLTV